MSPKKPTPNPKNDRLELRYIDLDELRRWSSNPKRHDIGQIVESIKRYGFKDPPKFEPTLNKGKGGLVEGNGRDEALLWMKKENPDNPPRGIILDKGRWLVPVLFGVDAQSQAAAEAYAVDHNNLVMSGSEMTAVDMAGIWDLESYNAVLQKLAQQGQFAVSVDSDDVDLLNKLVNPVEPPEDAGAQIDRADELLKIWKVQRGDLWKVGEHLLLCGDSTKREDVERVMGGEKADMVFIDPPYGVDYEGGANNEKKRKKLKGDETGDLYAPILKMCKESVRKSAPMYVWFAASVGKPVYDAVHAIGYEVRAMIIWNKLDAHYGAFMAQYMQKHEPCLYIVDGNPNFIGASNEVTVWDVKQPSKNDLHPTQKPVDLALRAIGNHDAPMVIDFCAGSGTTIVACERLGRKARAIEISPAYVAVCLQRMQDTFGITGVRILQSPSQEQGKSKGKSK